MQDELQGVLQPVCTCSQVLPQGEHSHPALLAVIVALVLSQLGLEPMHSVAIIGFNSSEWLMADLGAIFAGYDCIAVCITTVLINFAATHNNKSTLIQ